MNDELKLKNNLKEASRREKAIPNTTGGNDWCIEKHNQFH